MASEWLNSVIVRLVTKKNATGGDDGGGLPSSPVTSNDQEDKHLSTTDGVTVVDGGMLDRSHRGEEDYNINEDFSGGSGGINDDDDDDVGCSDSSPQVFTRRDKFSGGIVIDLEVDTNMANMIKQAMNFANIQRQSHAKNGGGMKERVGSGDGSWELLVKFPIVSVIFQQGINEQQAVCNAISHKALLFQV